MSKTDTRTRIIDAAAELMRWYGYTGTGLKQISTRSQAPFGSIYHFFPGGKDELAATALRASGAGYQLLVESVFDTAADPVAGIEACFAGAAEVLRQTDYADACPIETVALEVASTNEPLRLVTAEVFDSWIESATARLEHAGLSAPKARELAIAFICALEGAFVLSRGLKSTEPMEAAARSCTAALRAAMQDMPEPGAGP